MADGLQRGVSAGRAGAVARQLDRRAVVGRGARSARRPRRARPGSCRRGRSGRSTGPSPWQRRGHVAVVVERGVGRGRSPAARRPAAGRGRAVRACSGAACGRARTACRCGRSAGSARAGPGRATRPSGEVNGHCGTVSVPMIEAIRAGLAARANPLKAPEMQAYMKSEMPFYGVQKPARAALARELFTDLDEAAWRDTVLTLWREATVPRGALPGDRRAGAPALPGVPNHGRAAGLRGADRQRRVVGLRGCGRRGTVGRSAAGRGPGVACVVGDPDLWRRRAAIIAQVRRKAATDFALLTDVIEPNRGDREFFIRKAIGWALRSYAWVDPGAVVGLLRTHELSPLSRREALKHAGGQLRQDAPRRPDVNALSSSACGRSARSSSTRRARLVPLRLRPNIVIDVPGELVRRGRVVARTVRSGCAGARRRAGQALHGRQLRPVHRRARSRT